MTETTTETDEVGEYAAALGRPLPRWLVVLLGVLTITTVTGTALSPYLLVEAPILLVGLSPDAHHIALAAPQASFVWLLLVGTARRVVGMIATYGLVSHFGPAGMEWMLERWPRLERFVRWFERLFRRFSAPLLIVAPSYGTAALAGATGMTWRRFVPPMVVGQLAFTAGLLLFGASTSALIEPILEFVRTHVWECTAAMVMIVAAQRLYARWRRRPKMAASS